MNVFQETVIDFLQMKNLREKLSCFIREDLDKDKKRVVFFDYDSHKLCKTENELFNFSTGFAKALRGICLTVRRRDVPWEVNVTVNGIDVAFLYEPLVGTNTPSEYYISIRKRGQKFTRYEHAFSVQPFDDSFHVEELEKGKSVYNLNVDEKKALSLMQDYLSRAIE